MQTPRIRQYFHQSLARASAVLVGLFSAMPAFAQVRRDSLLGGGLGQRIRDFTRIFGRNSGLQEVPLSFTVARVIYMFLSLLGLIFVGLITYAGYHWVTARGNEEKVRKAQDTIRQSVWGLIIVLAAYSLSYFIIKYLLGEFSSAPPAPLEQGGVTS